MHTAKTYLFPALVLILSLSFFVEGWAQKRVQILTFSEIRRVTLSGEAVQKLYDVRLATDDFEMVCDSAWQYLERDEIRAFGNIQVDTEGKKIWADSLTYFTDRDYSQLRSRVIIATDTTTIFSESADYIFSLELAQFKKSVRLEDADGGILLAREGEYFQQRDSAIFRGNVQLADSSQYAEGDSLYYNRPSSSFQFFGNVFAVDSTENAVSTGDYFAGDSTGRRRLRGNAYLRRIEIDTTAANTLGERNSIINRDPTAPDSLGKRTSIIKTDTLVSDSLVKNNAVINRDSTGSNSIDEPEPVIKRDTTHINAREILLLEDDTTTYTNAYGNVKIWSTKFSSVSDTSLYNSTTEIFQLRSKPKAWNNNIQLTGPYIQVQLDSGNVKQLLSYLKPIVVQQDSATNRLNQIKGDTLIANFNNGAVSKVTAFPNSEIFYYTTDDAGNPDGALRAETPKTIIFFVNGEPELVKMGKNTGVFIPESPGVADMRLDGFAWNPELRPKRPANKPESQYSPIPVERPFELPRRYVEFLQEKSE